MDEEEPQQAPTPRRSLRRQALTEVNAELSDQQTPKKTSPNEMVIIQRGPRRKPIVWSPVDYNRTKLLDQPRNKTPEKKEITRKPDLNPKLRRRLALSPSKASTCTLGQVIAKKLRSLPKFGNEAP